MFGCTCELPVCVFAHFAAHEARGCNGTRHSLRPPFSKGEREPQNPDGLRRGNEILFLIDKRPSFRRHSVLNWYARKRTRKPGFRIRESFSLVTATFYLSTWPVASAPIHPIRSDAEVERRPAYPWAGMGGFQGPMPVSA